MRKYSALLLTLSMSAYAVAPLQQVAHQRTAFRLVGQPSSIQD